MRSGLHRGWVFFGVSLGIGAALLALLSRKPQIGPVQQHGERQALVVYCAAGIRPPVEAIVHEYERAFGVQVQLQYGGSGTLLANARVSKMGDLFLAADAQTTQQAHQQGLTAENLPLATIRPVIAFRKGNFKRIETLGDLLREDVTVALANPQAASVGKATEAALKPTGLWEKLVAKTTVFKPTVGEVANDIKLGTVDVGIIWDATVRQYPELDMVGDPALDKARETVAISVLNSSSQPSAALRLARYLAASDKGLREFARRGYEPVAGDSWAETPELLLYSGAMNRLAVEQTIGRFELREGVTVTRVYNGCGILLAQMKGGASPDAYLTCDKSFVTPVADMFPGAAVELSDSAIVLLVARGNPKHLAKLEDLARPGLRVGIANAEQSTLGTLTRRLLERAGIADAVTSNVVTEVPTADLLVNQMRTGALDVAIVYASNTTPVRGVLESVELGIPEALAVQTFSVNRKSHFKHLAARLLASLESKQSRCDYEQAGFHWRDSHPDTLKDSELSSMPQK